MSISCFHFQIELKTKMVKLSRLLVLLFAIAALCESSAAQDKPNFKFGKPTVADFSVQVPAYDSGAHAIIIGDMGESVITPNKHGGFGYEFRRKIRVKVLDVNGFDAGKFDIAVYSSRNSESKEEVTQLKGISYNLDNGKIIETRLDNSQVFTEKTSKYQQHKKFSLPALKAGTVFELNYTIASDFLFDFRPWEFQHEYPCLWSEYQTEIPEFYNYVFLTQGYLPYSISKKSTESRGFQIQNIRSAESSVDNSFRIDGLVYINRWVIKDVPSIKEESFTTSIENHRSKIEFQLSSITYPQQATQLIMESWPKVTKEFMQHENFGEQIEKTNGWLNDDLKAIIGDAKEPLEKTRKIFGYLRDNFTCTQHYGLYASSALKNVFKTKSGSVADINLLLLAMLKHENIECYPIILSTRAHGVTNSLYPLLDRFNYVSCLAVIGENEYTLDASVQNLPFGQIDINCYNGHARVLTENTTPIVFSADSVTEKSVTMANFIVEKNALRGRVNIHPGIFASVRNRATIKDKGEAAFFENIKTDFGSDFTITNTGVDSLKKLDNPIKIYYDIAMKEFDEDVVYLNPVILPFFKDNPFRSATRLYPVEIPYRIDQTYILNLNLPDGYKVDEIPKSAKVKFNEDEGFFEYLISASDGMIQLRTRLALYKANFLPDDYDTLRDFFGFIVKKQAEQIVLKKK
jgi:hypothetical protein